MTTAQIDTMALKELPKNIEPFSWLQTEPQDYKAKINCIIPAGSDSGHPYNRYEIEFESGEKIVLSQGLLEKLFKFTGVVGYSYEKTFDQTVNRIEEQKAIKKKGKNDGN